MVAASRPKPSPIIVDRVGTLLVRAAHRAGIVSTFAHELACLGVTLIDSSHHTYNEVFFQRIEFDPACDRSRLERGLHELGERFGMTWRISYGDRKRIAVLVSKEDHCLFDLLLRHRAGELACDVAMVISNHAHAQPIATHFGIPFHVVPITAANKQRQEHAMLDLIEHGGVDLIVLARYMQILSQAFVARYDARIINVHHSFLPAFVGANPYRQAYERGVKMIGATSHYVTSVLDAGPIIEQATVRCAHRDTVEDLVRKGRDLEKHVLAAAVRWHIDDRVIVHAGKTVVFD